MATVGKKEQRIIPEYVEATSCSCCKLNLGHVIDHVSILWAVRVSTRLHAANRLGFVTFSGEEK